LGEAVGARLPKWAWRAAVHLPTATFKVLRTAKYLAHQIGHHVVQKKLDAAQQGLETNSDIDIFDILRELFIPLTYLTTEDEYISQSKSLRQEEWIE
jgi:hypothetical protein